MRNAIKVLTATLIIAGWTSSASATLLVEDFEAAFPAWESGWLGIHSNLQNIYGVGGGRGNNPDGLWIYDGNGGNGGSFINFDIPFGSTLTSLSLDIASYTSATLQIFDISGNLLLNTVVTNTFGAFTDPGAYAHYSATSSNGIGGFNLIGGGVEGNLSIDNVTVNQGAEENVPEPGAVALLGIGLLGLGLRRRNA